MSFLETTPIPTSEPEPDMGAQVIDITAELRKAKQQVEASDGRPKAIRVGTYEFNLADSLSAMALSDLSEATAGDTTRVDLLIDGLTRLIQRDDRDSFRAFLDEEEVTAGQLGALTEQIVKVISGKD